MEFDFEYFRKTIKENFSKLLDKTFPYVEMNFNINKYVRDNYDSITLNYVVKIERQELEVWEEDGELRHRVNRTRKEYDMRDRLHKILGEYINKNHPLFASEDEYKDFINLKDYDFEMINMNGRNIPVIIDGENYIFLMKTYGKTGFVFG